MNKRRVVVVGRGVTSALGFTPDELYENLASGLCAVREMNEWGNGKYAAPVSLPEGAEKRIPRQFRRSMGKIGIYSAFAAQEAVAESGLSAEELSSGRCGCVIGSTMGGSESIAETFHMLGQGRAEELPATQFFKCVSHTAAFNTANLLNIRGVVQSPSAACASGLQSIGMGRDLIAWGVQDLVLCGGAEELSQEVNGSFDMINASLNSFGNQEKTGSRPFDAARTGLVCGEGAGVVLLEELEHALRRGAFIYGEITGYATCGCGSNISQSDAAAIERCLDLVYRDAELAPENTDYISAHATSTLQGDREEASALRSFFGSSSIPVSSLKGHLGHTLGASGALELIVCLEMMRRGELLPTLHLDTVAEDCSGLDHVRQIRRAEINNFLKNCFAFGGINATLLCSKYTNKRKMDCT